MKTLLVALNAKYIHSSLAIRCLKAYCDARNPLQTPVELAEFTINNRVPQILQDIFERKPDIIGLSVYIWNVDMFAELVGCLKKVLPMSVVVAGGPEAAHDPELLLGLGVDAVVIGEGEYAFSEIIAREGKNLSGIHGVATAACAVADVCTVEGLPLADIPFAYQDGFSLLSNKIIYYETSRGCPYGCKYCLSASGHRAGEERVRRLPFERVRRELDIFLQSQVRQVKLVDRTFNCDKRHALQIWRYLTENDNGVTNFHFEISAGILDREMLEALKKARLGLFQLEIGIQSTNIETLKMIGRQNDLDELFKNVAEIKKFGNIHQHLDLIAGLPGEDFNSFKESFNQVYALQPEQLQLGFLKLLKGSKLRAEAENFKILFSDKAPYEVLLTGWMDYEDMIRLKRIEEVLEIYYNSGQFTQSVKFLAGQFESPFDFFDALAQFWRQFEFLSPGKAALFERLLDFARLCRPDAEEPLRDLLRFDLCLNENPKHIPERIAQDVSTAERFAVREFMQVKSRSGARVEKFNYAVADYAGGGRLVNEVNFVLFDYMAVVNTLNTGIHCGFVRLDI